MVGDGHDEAKAGGRLPVSELRCHLGRSRRGASNDDFMSALKIYEFGPREFTAHNDFYK